MKTVNMPICEKCGRAIDRIDIDSPYVNAFNNDVELRPMTINTGISRVMYRCHGEKWTVQMLAEDANALVDRIRGDLPTSR